jgi:hypothetical protein
MLIAYTIGQSIIQCQYTAPCIASRMVLDDIVLYPYVNVLRIEIFLVLPNEIP